MISIARVAAMALLTCVSTQPHALIAAISFTVVAAIATKIPSAMSASKRISACTALLNLPVRMPTKTELSAPVLGMAVLLANCARIGEVAVEEIFPMFTYSRCYGSRSRGCRKKAAGLLSVTEYALCDIKQGYVAGNWRFLAG